MTKYSCEYICEKVEEKNTHTEYSRSWSGKLLLYFKAGYVTTTTQNPINAHAFEFVQSTMVADWTDGWIDGVC